MQMDKNIENITTVKELAVLAVDDDPSILRFLKSTLPKWGFKDVTCKNDAREAIKLMQEKQFAVVLLDYSMPHLNGHEYRKRVAEISPDTICILITAHGQAELMEATMQNNFYGYLEKPFPQNTLIAQVLGGLDAYLLHKSQKLIKQAKDEWLDTVDNLPHLVFRVSRDNKLLRLNRQALEYLRVSSYQEVLGGQIIELIPEAKEIIERINQTHAGHNEERKIGTKIYTIATVPLHQDGKFSGYNLTFTDITMLINAKDKCSRADRMYSLGLTRATIANDTSRLTHLLHSSLCRVKQDMDCFYMLLENKGFNNNFEIMRNMEDLYHDIKSVNTIDMRLSDHIRSELHKAASTNDNVASYAWLDLNQLLKSYITEITQDFAYASIDYKEVTLPMVCIDRMALYIAMSNLCRNSVEACVDCCVTIRASHLAQDNIIKLTVKDDAGGMSPKIADCIFEPFFTTKGGDHLGFGLNSVKRFVKSHKGKISLQSNQGYGTKIEILLPLQKFDHKPKINIF